MNISVCFHDDPENESSQPFITFKIVLHEFLLCVSSTLPDYWMLNCKCDMWNGKVSYWIESFLYFWRRNFRQIYNANWFGLIGCMLRLYWFDLYFTLDLLSKWDLSFLSGQNKVAYRKSLSELSGMS